MKTLLTTLLGILLLATATPTYAQSRGGTLERVLERVISQEQQSAPTTTPTTTPATTTSPTEPPEETPLPDPEPTPEIDPVPEEEEEEPIPLPPTPPESSGGASADPEVLAAQHSGPTAGAGNVYRSNTLSTDTTYALLTVAFVCGIVGLMLGAPRRTPEFIPQPLTSA